MTSAVMGKTTVGNSCLQVFLAVHLYDLDYWGFIEPRIGDQYDDVKSNEVQAARGS